MKSDLTIRITAVSLIISVSAMRSAPCLASGDLPDNPKADLSSVQMEKIEDSMERALNWLALQQKSDGSFRTDDAGEPAVTSLCLLAFLAAGHLPGEGPHGKMLDRGINFVVGCQRPDGLLALLPTQPALKPYTPSHTAIYNHAFAGILLSEVYGMIPEDRSSEIRPAIEQALAFTRIRQSEPKRNRLDTGGWRYLRPDVNSDSDSDLSVTCSQLMFLRSAKGAGFNVHTEWIDEALDYVKRCFEEREGCFRYELVGNHAECSRGMVGAGILSLSLAGMHDTSKVQSAGNWLRRHPFDKYGETIGRTDHFHYGAFYCSYAMFQLGEQFWASFYSQLARTLLERQLDGGQWPPDRVDQVFGSTFSTALAVLALSPPHQMLPIFQR